MMVINAAYKVLKDPKKRAEYDRKRRVSGKGTWGSSSGREKGTTKGTPRTSNRKDTASSYWGPGHNGWNSEANLEGESGESLVDIMSDLWEELNTNGAVNLIDDLLSYLDVKVVSDCYLY